MAVRKFSSWRKSLNLNPQRDKSSSGFTPPASILSIPTCAVVPTPMQKFHILPASMPLEPSKKLAPEFWNSKKATVFTQAQQLRERTRNTLFAISATHTNYPRIYPFSREQLWECLTPPLTARFSIGG